MARPPIPGRETPGAPPLRHGDRLSRDEFERRYDAMPDLKRAELLRGVVCLARPVLRALHGDPHGRLVYWLYAYVEATPGVQAACAATVRLDLENEPQPDAILCVKPALGGRTVTSDDDYVEGPPELVAEVSAGTVRRDLGLKRGIYLEMGVREYLVVLTRRPRVDWFHLVGSAYVAIKPGADGIHRSRVFPGLWLEAGALLRGDLRRLKEVLAEGTASPEHARFAERLAGRSYGI